MSFFVLAFYVNVFFLVRIFYVLGLALCNSDFDTSFFLTLFYPCHWYKMMISWENGACLAVDPFQIIRIVFLHGHGLMIRIHLPAMAPGSRSIFHPWIHDPDPFSIHGSRIRIHFLSMNRGSGSIFIHGFRIRIRVKMELILFIDYINTAIIKHLKTICLLFLRHFTIFFGKTCRFYDSFDQLRYFLIILFYFSGKYKASQNAKLFYSEF